MPTASVTPAANTTPSANTREEPGLLGAGGTPLVVAGGASGGVEASAVRGRGGASGGDQGDEGDEGGAGLDEPAGGKEGNLRVEGPELLSRGAGGMLEGEELRSALIARVQDATS